MFKAFIIIIMVIYMDAEKIIIEIIEEIRPFLNMEGGDVEFIKYDKSEACVYVKLYGACANCMMQDETLENGLLEMITEKVPEVKNIINVPL